MSFQRSQKVFCGIAIVAGLMLLLTAPVLHACPGCGAALNNEAGAGFNLSIVYMMAMPFVLFGSIAFGIIYITHQKRTKISTLKSEEEKQ